MTQFPNDEQQLQPKAMATRILGLKKRHGWRNLDQKLQALRLDTAEFLVGASIRSEATQYDRLMRASEDESDDRAPGSCDSRLALVLSLMVIMFSACRRERQIASL